MRLGLSLALLLLAACDDSSGEPDAGGPCPPSCDDGVYCNGVESCGPAGCVPGVSPCAASERCIETEDRCEPGCETPDGDGDGEDAVVCGGDDCDDTDPDVFSGAIEICDAEGVDEDCDPTTVGDLDADDDGAVDARCCNGATCGTDCDDRRDDTLPGAGERCNERDDDCDGEVDEGVAIDGFTDADGDLYGDRESPIRGCPGWPGISSSGLDCDDDDPTVHGAQAEIRDSRDNDCDGATDEEVTSQTWYVDSDGDGFGDGSEPTMSSDEPIAGHSLLGSDCDDDDATRTPVSAERCNGRNDDCDPRTVYVLGPNDSEDDDGDRWPDAACPGVDAADADCDDRDALVHPEAPERCNERDDDCDGAIDESCESDGCDDVCDSPADVLSGCGCAGAQACVVMGPSAFGCMERGTGVAGDECADDSECAGDHICRDGRCLTLCAPADQPCADGGLCTANLFPIDTLNGFPAELAVCTDRCDPMADLGCPTGQTCSIAAAVSGYYPYCRAISVAPLAAGAACGLTSECAAGLTCELLDFMRRCVDVCPFSCPSGSECGVLRDYADGGSFRFCVPE